MFEPQPLRLILCRGRSASAALSRNKNDQERPPLRGSLGSDLAVALIGSSSLALGCAPRLSLQVRPSQLSLLWPATGGPPSAGPHKETRRCDIILLPDHHPLLSQNNTRSNLLRDFHHSCKHTNLVIFISLLSLTLTLTSQAPRCRHVSHHKVPPARRPRHAG